MNQLALPLQRKTGYRRRPGPFTLAELVERTHVTTTGCWVWLGETNNSGYGRVSLHGRRVLAHRAAFELHHHVSILPGYQVCHDCDNPPCCNPAHLFLDTMTGNLRDAAAKGRLGKSRRRLPYAQVEEIRYRHQAGESPSALAAVFSVHITTIRDIVRGRSRVGK